jgi:hypothetical protein
MMISEEQALRAAQQLHLVTVQTGRPTVPDVSQQVIDLAVLRATQAPETRPDRIRIAREHLSAGCFDSHEVAEKMLQRIVGDALR